MKKIIISIILCFVLKPLSAQVDSGFSKCNLDFTDSILSIAQSGLDTNLINERYKEINNKWQECTKDYNIPNFSGVTLDNDTFKLNEIKDKVIVIDFWGLHCPPCMAEFEMFDSLIKNYKNKDVIFISIVKETPFQILKHFVPQINTIANAKSIIELYGIDGYPQTFVINKNHKIRHKFFGFSLYKNEFEDKLKLEINKALIE